MNNLLFVIGIRRSGTSILRNLMLKHPKITDIEFEPYELWHAIRVSHLSRYKNDYYIQRIINRFRSNTGGWKGAKFALNAGIEAMTWRRLALVFPEAKFIFINRSSEATWRSWNKVDEGSVRGLCDKYLYTGFRNLIVESFNNFKNGFVINYKDLVEDTENQMNKLFKFLEIEPMKGLSDSVHKPENWEHDKGRIV